jgi:hypothetical protein
MTDSFSTPPNNDSPVRAWIILSLVVLAVSVVGIGFDRMLVREGIPRYDLMAVSNVLTGLVAGGLFWQARRRERERRNFIRERLRTISEMNHHIRNALQVIAFYSYKEKDEKTVKMLGDAVTRIEWALIEILPAELLGEPRPELWRPPSKSQPNSPESPGRARR